GSGEGHVTSLGLPDHAGKGPSRGQPTHTNMPAPPAWVWPHAGAGRRAAPACGPRGPADETATPPGRAWVQRRDGPRRGRGPNGVWRIEPGTPCPAASPRAGIRAVVHAAAYRDAGPSTGSEIVWGGSAILGDARPGRGGPRKPPGCAFGSLDLTWVGSRRAVKVCILTTAAGPH